VSQVLRKEDQPLRTMYPRRNEVALEGSLVLAGSTMYLMSQAAQAASHEGMVAEGSQDMLAG